MKREAEQLSWLSLFRAECHATAARFFSNVHTVAGTCAAGLAAAAGGTAFAGETTVAGVAGVASAAVAGLLTVAKPDERTQGHWQAATSYSRLAEETSARFGIGSPTPDVASDVRPALTGPEPPDAVAGQDPATGNDAAALKVFREQMVELEARSFPVPRRHFRKTQRQVRKYGQWFAPIEPDAFDKWRLKRLGHRGEAGDQAARNG